MRGVEQFPFHSTWTGDSQALPFLHSEQPAAQFSAVHERPRVRLLQDQLASSKLTLHICHGHMRERLHDSQRHSDVVRAGTVPRALLHHLRTC